MRIVESSRSRRCARVAALTLLAASAAGCSTDVTRFNSNPSSGPMAARQAPPAREVTGSVPAPRVDAQPLPPPSRPMVSSTGPYYAPPPRNEVVANNPPVYRPQPRPMHAPTRVATMPARAPAPQAMRAPATVHVVAHGQTLASIGRIYGKSGTEIARANRLPLGVKLHAGQKVTIPGVSKGVVKTASAEPPAHAPAAPPTKPVVVAKTAPAPAHAPTPAPAATPAPVQTAKLPPAAPNTKVASTEPMATARLATPTTETREAATETTGSNPSFRWPVRGRVIGAFGAKINGQQNDGINLSVPEGTSVKAAEDGVVAYSGNELKGYGNLVLVRHASGFVTAYAHASEVMVKRGDKVKRGQIIAKAGQTGGVSSPQLHFEIRKGSTPVDPGPFLDKGGNG
jgi:murein DD-endopeptidase MepM/ murein hydrolase activator NlpD